MIWNFREHMILIHLRPGGLFQRDVNRENLWHREERLRPRILQVFAPTTNKQTENISLHWTSLKNSPQSWRVWLPQYWNNLNRTNYSNSDLSFSSQIQLWPWVGAHLCIHDICFDILILIFVLIFVWYLSHIQFWARVGSHLWPRSRPPCQP